MELTLQGVLLSALSTVLTVLVSWISHRLITWINSKIASTKHAQYFTHAVEIITRSVQTIYQTYVETLKDKNMFTKEAQEEALKQAKDMAISQLSDEVKDYIQQHFGDFENWLNCMVESTIYQLKNKPKEGQVSDKGN